MRQQTKLWQILLLVLTFVLLATWSWRKTMDILVDFGAQLYNPWQLASGKVLYVDLAYLPGGPFSQYFNAAVFKLFDSSLTTLILTNLALTALLVVVTFRFFRKISDAASATAICFAVIGLFPFAEMVPGGNFNYITPYSHDALHGLVLSVLALCFFSRWVLRGDVLSVVVSGACVGLVFLTKPDIFLAIILTGSLTFIIHWREQTEKRVWLRSLLLFLGVASVPLLLAYGYFQQFQSARDALQSVSWAWVPLLTTPAVNNNFYRWCMGLDDPFGNTLAAFFYFIAFSTAVALCAWSARRSNNTLREYILRGAILTAVLAGLWQVDLKDAGMALLFLTPSIFLVLLYRCWQSTEERHRLMPALLWSVFSVGMLAKMGFFARIWHYGVFLAMPATALTIYFIFSILPPRLERWGVQANKLRLIGSLLLLVVVGKVWWISHATYSLKDQTAGEGADRIRFYNKTYYPPGTAISAAAEWLKTNTRPDQTVAALPEGSMLNFLSRRRNSTPYVTVSVPEVQGFGEDKILAAFQANPPDYIALVVGMTSAGGSNYGVGAFGSPDYAPRLRQWIREHYQVVHVIAARAKSGVHILRLNSKEQLK